MFENPKSTPLQPISDELLNHFGVKLFIKREDLIDSSISGNKWRKLKYNFIEAKRQGFNTILTCGGAYSNHIAAVASACSRYGFKSIGIIRGEENNELNATLSKAKDNGMKFIFWSREKFKNGFSDEVVFQLQNILGEFYFIPEGGTNSLAVDGTKEIVDNINIAFDFVCSSVGSGGTLAGLIDAKKDFIYKVLGFSALKNNGFLEIIVDQLIGKHSPNPWSINSNYTFGGYAKFNKELVDFINNFYVRHNIELDPVYTGKMMYGIYDLVKQGFFHKGTVVVAIHTGGLQGKSGFNKRFGKILL